MIDKPSLRLPTVQIDVPQHVVFSLDHGSNQSLSLRTPCFLLIPPHPIKLTLSTVFFELPLFSSSSGHACSLPLQRDLNIKSIHWSLTEHLSLSLLCANQACYQFRCIFGSFTMSFWISFSYCRPHWSWNVLLLKSGYFLQLWGENSNKRPRLLIYLFFAPRGHWRNYKCYLTAFFFLSCWAEILRKTRE